MAAVLVVVFDSLRKDVFDRCRHPLLESWRERGTVFENCWSQSGFTAISFASLLGGCFPSGSGVRSVAPPVLERGPTAAASGPVWWSLDRATGARLVLQGSRPLRRSAFSRFERCLLAIDHAKTNAFAELRCDEMTPSLEHGQAANSFLRRYQQATAGDDWLVVLRVYDTHLPYGRGRSPCDAPTPAGIKHKAAALFSAEPDRLQRTAAKALERALDYLAHLWRMVDRKVDAAAIMSDHGDQWAATPEDVGHARFLSDAVLRVPLVIIDREHTGLVADPCNNADVVPTLLALCGKPLDWPVDGERLPLDGARRSGCWTEANSMDGKTRVGWLPRGG